MNVSQARYRRIGIQSCDVRMASVLQIVMATLQNVAGSTGHDCILKGLITSRLEDNHSIYIYKDIL